MKKIRVASWNINSLRFRLETLKKFIDIYNPTIISLQETKVEDHAFPHETIKNYGYDYNSILGQKSYHGVAILSKIPLFDIFSQDFGGKTEARHICASLFPNENIDPITIHNFYVPAGGDEPDPEINERFAYKLQYLDDMISYFGQYPKKDNLIMLGDINNAPWPNDVWSHKQLLNVICHTPIETEKTFALQDTLDWIDVGRHFIPVEEKLYSWWSYRNKDWKKSNRGRRLDHIWCSRNLGNNLVNYIAVKEARDWEKTSDHIPIMADFIFD